MKSAMLYGLNDLRVVEVDSPEVRDTDILIRVRAVGVCPTDVRKYRTGNHSKLSFPVNVGHEWSGDVVQVGANVRNISVGTRVAGLHRGGYAEYLRYDTTTTLMHFIFPLPDQVSYEQGAFLEPLADCVHSLRQRGQLSASDVLVILGAGQMALLHVMVAKAMGARVIVSEPLPSRRAWATEFGADLVIDPGQEDVIRQVREATGGTGADVVIVSVGIPTLVSQAVMMAAPRGRVVLFGGFANEAIVTLNPNVLHYGEISLTGSECIGVTGYEEQEACTEAISLMATGKAPVERLITGRFALDDIHKAFAMTENKDGLKAIILPNVADLA